MANYSSTKLISVTLMAFGIGMTYWGYDISGGLDSQINQAFTGSSTDGVMFRYIAGAASFAAGLFLLLKK